ncbi:hypothetical protein BJ508DRAFT_415991 [Ascobolus immersus RN42]|uniref:Uncharacterized protein n=1 Tax=Ascobolus immersus RN42 TaxID=1160509 RepID=A0A3N4I092_ASCIM|nr:hypothetical protein BJ508DRAFT_415991 [Ascobolus immersus RN42]
MMKFVGFLQVDEWWKFPTLPARYSVWLSSVLCICCAPVHPISIREQAIVLSSANTSAVPLFRARANRKLGLQDVEKRVEAVL